MSLCLHRGIAQKPITVRPPRDMFGLVAGGSGLALIYAALDQGNRLDWLNSGLDMGSVVRRACCCSSAFMIHEAVHAASAAQSEGAVRLADAESVRC